jgi:hypothetical protein
MSWVIPTAFTLIALQKLKDIDTTKGPAVNERIGLGISMLLDRMCLGGGWNAGNSVAFAVPYGPFMDATAIALLALSSQAPQSQMHASLSWLAARLAACPSPYSLAWGILALTAYHKKEIELSDPLRQASSALTAAIEKGGCAFDTGTLAISALALEAVDGDNVFTVGI